VAVFGLGPIGQMCCRIALHRGADQVFGIDLVPERLEMARRHGVQAIDLRGHEDVAQALREQTDGRGPDSVIDAGGMEAHGDPLAVEDLATHKLPLEQAPHAYEIFQKKEDGAVKILLQPCPKGSPRRTPGCSMGCPACRSRSWTSGQRCCAERTPSM